MLMRHGRAGGEDDLVRVRGVEEALHVAARRLVLLGRDVREIVQAAVDVGVFVANRRGHRVDHRLRLLRRGAVVEIDERTAVHLAREDREVAANQLDVVRQPRSAPPARPCFELQRLASRFPFRS